MEHEMLREQQRQLEQFAALLKNEERRFGGLFYIQNKRHHEREEFAHSLNVPLGTLDSWVSLADFPRIDDLDCLPRHILITARRIFMEDLR
jgi:DNA-binding transcriptional regulator YiaG